MSRESRGRAAFYLGLLITCLASGAARGAETGGSFRRGDSNADGRHDIADGVHMLAFLFTGAEPPGCRKAADVNDDGVTDISDPIHFLRFLFLGGPRPPLPFPACGTDPTPDDLPCHDQPLCAPPDPRRTLTFTLAPPRPEITPGARGVSVSLPGFDPQGFPGDPRLPGRSYSIVLPPGADPSTVEVRVDAAQSLVRPVGKVAPVGGWVEFQEDAGETPIPREDGLQLQEGWNTTIYGVDRFHPEAVVGTGRVESFRGWKVLSVPVTPVQYNDARGVLRVTGSVTISVSFEEDENGTSPLHLATGLETIRHLVDEERLQSWAEIARSYDVSPDIQEPSGDYDYVIVTADTIYDERDENGLQAFIEHKELLGHKVKVGLTGDIDIEYSGEGDQQRRIKEYLEDCYDRYAIKYVLLVGNPDALADGEDALIPDQGVVPMRECLPRGQSSMTDMYYADYDADWDDESGGDGDGKYAENWDETGYPDVLVGRVAPVGGTIDDVYDSSGDVILTLDHRQKLKTVFEKMIRYDREIDKSWRYDMLAAGSYMYGTKGGTTASTLSKTIAYLHDDDSRFSAYTVFQDGTAFGLEDEWFDGAANPEASAALAGSGTLGNTSTAFYAWTQKKLGIVLWRGHGSATGVDVGDNLDEDDEDTIDGSLFVSYWILRPSSYSGYGLGNEYPAVVYSASCNNFSTGYSAYGSYTQTAKWASLAQCLQYLGGICVVGATNTTTSESPCPEDPAFGQSAWYQREFLRKVVQGWTFGKAYMNAKRQVQTAWGSNHKDELTDWLRINLLGDPSQQLFEDIDVFPDDDLDEGSGNDDLDHASVIHSGSYTADPDRTDLSVRVLGAVSKDTDCYVLEDVGNQSKQVKVTASRNESMGDLGIKVFNDAGNSVPGSETTSATERTFTVSTRSATVYIIVNKGQFVLDYDLKVEVDDE